MTTSDDEDREYPKHPLVGVGAIVIKRGKVVPVRRGREPSKGLWSIPGGLVKIEETVKDAVKREVMEDTGIAVEPRGLFEVVDAVYRDEKGECRCHHVILDYLSEYQRGKIPAGGEVTGARWFSARETDGIETTMGARTVVERAFRERKR